MSSIYSSEIIPNYCQALSDFRQALLGIVGFITLLLARENVHFTKVLEHFYLSVPDSWSFFTKENAILSVTLLPSIHTNPDDFRKDPTHSCLAWSGYVGAINPR